MEITRELRSTTAHWVDQDGQTLFKEDLYDCEIPPKGRQVRWHRKLYKIEDVTQDLDHRKTYIYLLPV